MYSRDYRPLQNAGMNLAQSSELTRTDDSYSSYEPPQPQYAYSQAPPLPNRSRAELSAFDELDILDKYSQPLLQRQGGELMGAQARSARGYSANNQNPDYYGSFQNPSLLGIPQPNPSYNPSMPFPGPYAATMPMQIPIVERPRKRRDSQKFLQREMKEQLAKQNDILQRLAENVAQENKRKNQPKFNPQADKYAEKIREMEKDFQMKNELQNLRREISDMNAQKQANNNPFQQQQPFQAMMGNNLMNPMLNMMMGQLGMNPFQQPFLNNPFQMMPQNQSPPKPQTPKKEIDNRLEQMLTELLKERALSNALRDDLGMNNQQYLPPPPERSRNYGSVAQTANTKPSYYFPPSTAQKQPTIRSQQASTPQSVQPRMIKDVSRAKRLIRKFVLFVRWIKLELIQSRMRFKLHEMEEFKSDLEKTTASGIPWLSAASTKGFKSIILSCKKEQDISDPAVGKLSQKEQDERFTDYTKDCDFLIDDLIAAVPSIPENMQLFIAKKFFNHCYFTNDPVIFNYFLGQGQFALHILVQFYDNHVYSFQQKQPFLSQFEIDRLQFEGEDMRLIGLEEKKESPQFVMLLLLFIIVKIYIPQLLIAPWKNPSTDPSVVFTQNYISFKKLAIISTLFYRAVMDHLGKTVPLVQRPPNQTVWKQIPSTLVCNNNEKITNLVPINSTKNDILTLFVTKENLATFFSKKAQWYEGFQGKLAKFASEIFLKMGLSREAFLELRKDMLQEKAKELQRFIPPGLRNVKLY